MEKNDATPVKFTDVDRLRRNADAISKELEQLQANLQQHLDLVSWRFLQGRLLIGPSSVYIHRASNWRYIRMSLLAGARLSRRAQSSRYNFVKKRMLW